MDIPFTSKQFFDVIGNYNSGVFPAQIIILITGLITVSLILTKNKYANRVNALFLSFLWLWIGIAYHLVFFTTINPAAYGFGSLFILQGLFFLFEHFRGRLSFNYGKDAMSIIGFFFILFGLIIYPVISYFAEGNYLTIITPGLPCPSTIFTFGVLMLSSRKLSKYLVIIPILWAIIGTGAATNFGVYQDYVMLLAAIICGIYLLKRKKADTV